MSEQWTAAALMYQKKVHVSAALEARQGKARPSKMRDS